jgi:superoxide dismutase, Cu-Zn family
VTIADSPQGARITLDLHRLPAGQRGFHVHEKGSCAASKAPDGKPIPAGAAGGHYDPAGTSHHMGPEG